MDWLRAHWPSYSAIRSTTTSLTSSTMSGHPQTQQRTGRLRRASSGQAPLAKNSSRTLFVNAVQHPAHKFCGNQISTCKYNAFTFLPRFLIEQFRRYSNVFFLIIAVLQQIPDVSPTGHYTTAVPFLIILMVSAIKEIFEDIKRRRMDLKVNNYKVQVMNTTTGQLRKTRWKELQVGELIKVSDGQHFPADVVLISSSEPMGMAYIETAQLDGETNLKIRQSLPITAELTSEAKLRAFKAEIDCEPPNRKVNEFTGTLRIGQERYPLSIAQFLLRGAKLKNCHWVFGVVVYTGHDSRLLMNSTTPPLKTSRIDVLTNQRIVSLFFMLLLITFVSVIGAEMFNRWFLHGHWYLGPLDHWSFAWNMLTFFILYNNIIPISLQVTLEIVRFFQASYINQDIEMYDEASDMCAMARTSNLNEELGQVQFLMTDKTGTLTRNIMTFKRCQVGMVGYGDDDREDFDDPELRRDMLSGQHGNGDQIREFLTMLATCHTVVPEREESGRIRFQASSPDEAALVRGAQNQGFVFHTRRPNKVIIEADGTNRSFELLHVLEFTSDRKRMSVIVREQNNKNNIKLFCKGADNIIYERLSNGTDNQEMLDSCNQALSDYANKGYRTLCFAAADLDPKAYTEWANEYKEAATAIEERELKVGAVAEKIERNMRLVAVTAIEDKLQDNVPLTIRTLLDAGIRIWMLTGDKLETAVQIAQSSSLCVKETKLMILQSQSYDGVLQTLRDFTQQSRNYLASDTEFALVIDGASLHHAVIGEAKRIFANLIFNCHSVICCRMTPIQKAEIVEIVKALGNKTVMAVGDGANDVAMIQAANVGVGISGVEGLQAASASDYSIAQFQFLLRLLLVHGTWNFERSVKVILYSFYKNICLYIIELWFALFSAFSGVTIFERWTIAMFNVFFTAWPPIILGLFDRPMSQRVILKRPELYQTFQQSAFSNGRCIMWVIVSIWHSLVLFFLSYGFYASGGIEWSNGRNGGWLMFGNALYTFVVATVCLKALLECDSWTWIIVGFCLGSILLWFGYLLVYAWVWPWFSMGADMRGMFWVMVTSTSFWMALLFIPIATLLFDFVVKSICTSLMPSARERFCLREKRRTPSRTCGCNITDLADGGGMRYEEVRQHSEEVAEQQHRQQFMMNGGHVPETIFQPHQQQPLPLPHPQQQSSLAPHSTNFPVLNCVDSTTHFPSRSESRKSDHDNGGSIRLRPLRLHPLAPNPNPSQSPTEHTNINSSMPKPTDQNYGTLLNEGLTAAVHKMVVNQQDVENGNFVDVYLGSPNVLGNRQTRLTSPVSSTPNRHGITPKSFSRKSAAQQPSSQHQEPPFSRPGTDGILLDQHSNI